MEMLLSLKGILLILLFSWHADSVFIRVQTDVGTILGTLVIYYDTYINLATNNYNTRVNQFLGIPFAKPPIGPLRFKRPQPAENFTSTFVADKMPNACIQFSGRPFPWYDNGPHSEDCLYLNIWAPAQRDGNLPVMFWIYGGGFTVGSNRQSVYDGRALAAKGVVVVTINYRLGVFGFLTSGTEEAPGNNGMYDMLEALTWVRRNIAAFGGDPNQVTLVGESAGSIAIGLLCVSPLTEGLFHRVIMESGSPAYTLADNSKNDSIATSQALAEAVNCAAYLLLINREPERVLSCLRNKDAMFLAATLNEFHPNSARSFFPFYGDEILPKNARQALIDASFHNVHVLIGNNADEGAFQLTTGNPELFGFFGEKDPVISKTQAEEMLRATFRFNFPNPQAVIDHYLGNVRDDDHVTIRRNVYTAMGDWSLLCPTVFFAESYSRAGNPVHFYYFMHRPDTSPWAEWMGAVHFEEVQFVFGGPLRNATATRDDRLLSDLMVKIWTDFAKTGFTGVFGGVDWPQYSRENPVYLKLNNTVYNHTTTFQDVYGQGPHKEHCDFFRSYFGF